MVEVLQSRGWRVLYLDSPSSSPNDGWIGGGGVGGGGQWLGES